MAAKSVTADNDRVAVATAATDAGTWGNDGGGGGVADEPDLVYQGTTSQSRKVSTSLIGRQYSGGTTRDATAADREHFLFKLNVTNYGALNTRTTPGSELKIGSDGSNYDSYYLFGSDNYPAAGGWQFVAISINIAGYRPSLTTGSPTRTAIDYYSWLCDFTATSKSENIMIDAIDLGRGLKLVGGDGADPDALFDDFLSADQGTTNNRWGYVRSLGGIYYCNGELAIGENTSESAVATVFQDTTGQVLVWENGLVETGYHRFRVNLGSATTDIDITGATFDSIGKKDNDGDRGYTTTEDSRLVFEVTGTSGALDLDSCTIKNSQDVTLTSATTLLDCDIEAESITQGSAELDGCVVRTTAITSVATVTDPTFGTTSGIHDCDFVQGGAGHALELSSVGATVTLTNITFSGYGATTSDAAAIDVTAASGTTTINWSGGTAPTYKTAGATVNVVNSVTVKVTVADETQTAVSGARVLLLADTGGDLPSDVTVTITRSGTTASVSHTAHGLSNGDKVQILGANEAPYNGVKTISNVSTNAYDYTVTGSPDTPATGTIKATAVILDGTTNGSGVIEDTGFAFTSTQGVTGRARQSTVTPYLKEATFTASITTAGMDVSVQMGFDE